VTPPEGFETNPLDLTEHFVGSLGLELWVEDGLTQGRTELHPGMLASASGTPRLGVLATLVDMVAGTPPSGALNPTVDLRIWLLSRPPSSGVIRLEARPAKFGRRLYVAETILHTGDADRPFARSTCTFMNEAIDMGLSFGPRGTPRAPVRPLEELLDARMLGDGTLEMDAHERVSNGPGGTVQGGAQALLAELAAERALADGGAATAVDLEIRFLNRVRGDRITARAEVDDGDLGIVGVRVPVVDTGPDPRMVSLVSLIFRTA
jgi:acyl-coenzyme A thioesterase PaaI-like protein